MSDINFSIEFSGFNEGNSPLAHLDSKTFIGNRGQASQTLCDIISQPGFITQGPALADLTNGTQAGVVDQLIRFILDKPTAADVTYALGTSKMFKLSSTTVVSGGSPSWPQAITDMTEGESIVRLGANVYAFFNKASGGDIAKMVLSSEAITANWGSATDTALIKAPHPSAVKEDIMLFGNGQYVGAYVEELATLDTQKLDFKEGSEVADIVFNANLWWIAVNYGEGRGSQVFVYDGSATSNQLSDEAGVGLQEIGFLFVQNGIIYVSYKDKTSSGYHLGYINGRQIKHLRSFTGSLPDHRQKTLYKDVILFIAGSNLWTMGASVDQLPLQISTLADGGYATLGAVAAPFGTPMVSSTDGATNFRLAKFSGYAVDSLWKSISVDITDKRLIGKVTSILVYTSSLNADAGCNIRVEGNQGVQGVEGNVIQSSNFVIEGINKTLHRFTSIDMRAVDSIRVLLDYSVGDATYTVPIRKIVVSGNFVER